MALAAQAEPEEILVGHCSGLPAGQPVYLQAILRQCFPMAGAELVVEVAVQEQLAAPGEV